MSGADASTITKQLLADEAFELEDRKVTLNWIKTPETKELIDQVCITYFKAPRSFTGEDIIEISCHGNPQIVKKLLEACYFYGADAAKEGDFSKRAFINGKMTLPQVEALGTVIDSDASQSIRYSLYQLKGVLLNTIKEIRKPLMDLLQHLEGSIDFPDEIEAMHKDDLAKSLKKIKLKVETIVKYKSVGELVKKGLKCVLVGHTNAGKSSVFNCLIGDERAIVTDIEGTTRDYITAQLECNGIIINLFDTAGFRDSEDVVEMIGINRMFSLSKDADIVCYVHDACKPLALSPSFKKILASAKNALLLINKSDLNTNQKIRIPSSFNQHFYISAKSKEGIASLMQYIQDEIIQISGTVNPDFICNARQLSIIQKVDVSLNNLINGLSKSMSLDQIAWDIKEICEGLSEFVGESITEEVLDGIFHSFCVGK